MVLLHTVMLFVTAPLSRRIGIGCGSRGFVAKDFVELLTENIPARNQTD